MTTATLAPARISRRTWIAGAGAAALLGAGGAYWLRRRLRHSHDLALTGDDGAALINKRLPEGAPARLAALPGLMRAGNPKGDVTLYEFFDYNCPECITAAADLSGLAKADPSLTVALVQNPIVSIPSAQAARIVLAVQALRGRETALAVHERLIGGKGRVDGLKAYAAAEAEGVNRSEIEPLADSAEIRAQLSQQMQAAKDLNLFATPSFVIGDVAMIGHPGPKTFAGMVEAMRGCGRVVCG